MTNALEIRRLVDEEKANEIATKFADIIDGASFITALGGVAFIVSRLNRLSPTPESVELTVSVLIALIMATETEEFVVN